MTWRSAPSALPTAIVRAERGEMTLSNPNEEEVVLRQRSTEGSALSAGLRWTNIRETVTKEQSLPVLMGLHRQTGGSRWMSELQEVSCATLDVGATRLVGSPSAAMHDGLDGLVEDGVSIGSTSMT